MLWAADLRQRGFRNIGREQKAAVVSRAGTVSVPLRKMCSASDISDTVLPALASGDFASCEIVSHLQPRE
jgi:hypothetical protein